MFQIYGIPDFDQKRSTLPNDGKMYCVPTSFINLIYYMGTHGISELLENIADSNNALLFSADPAQRYQAITWRIFDMGERCGTDPEGGTDGWDPFGATGYDGLRLYINSRTDVPINIVYYSSDDSFPNPADAIAWLQNGWLVAFCHGKYSEDYNRDGGHCVTLTGVHREWVEPPPPEEEDEDEIEPYNPHIEWNEEYVEPEPPPSGHWIYKFQYRDGVSGDSLSSQGPFASKVRGLMKEWHTWGPFGGFAGKYYPLWRIGSERRFVDTYYCVRPQMGLSNVIADGRTHLLFTFSNLFQPVASSDARKADSPPDVRNSDRQADEPDYAYTGPAARPAFDIASFRKQFGGSDPGSPIWTNAISDVVWMPVSLHAVFTIAGSDEIFGYNMTTGVTRRIIKLAAAPRKVSFGGYKRDMFVLLPEEICRVDMRDVYDRREKVKASAKAPRDAETLAFDETNQRLIVAAKSGLHFYDRDLTLLGATSVPALPGETKLTVRVSRQSGEVYFMRSGQRTVQKLRLSADSFDIRSSETIELGDSRSPLTFDLGTLDQIIISDDGRMSEYDRKGTRVRESCWNGFAAADCLELTQDFRNPPPFKDVTLEPDERNETEVPE